MANGSIRGAHERRSRALRSASWLGVLGIALLACGCAARRIAPAAAEGAATREGVTGVRVLEPADDSAADSSEADVQTLAPAIASEDNALPEYPLAALESGCGDGVIALRVTVTTDGKAALLRQVPGRPPPADGCHAAFRDATVEAVERWRFAPAQRRVRQQGRDVDGDGKADYIWWDQEPVTIYLDFEFTFRVVEGRGEVISR